MVARMIPVERPQTVEVWHMDASSTGGDLREDRLLAVSVSIPPRYRVPVHGTEPAAEWPLPLLVRSHAES